MRIKTIALFAVVLFKVTFAQDITESNTPFKQEKLAQTEAVTE